MKYIANKIYQNKNVAKEYDRRRFSSVKGRFTDWREKQLIEASIKNSAIIPPARIIDLPTGTGRVSIVLANLGYNVLGVDISEEMIKQGKAKIQGTEIEKRVEFQVCDGASLPLQDAEFDCSVSLRLFGHVPPQIRTSILKELNRVSKSHVVVAYYGIHTLQSIMRKKKRAQRNIPWYSVSNKEIREEMRDAGLKIISMKWLIPFISETVIVTAVKSDVLGESC